MTELWGHWASMVALALHHGDLIMLRQLILMAFAISLAVLASLGIYYGPRPVT